MLLKKRKRTYTLSSCNFNLVGLRVCAMVREVNINKETTGVICNYHQIHFNQWVILICLFTAFPSLISP